ncbi:MAG: mechanosensitive ion channel [Clostridia bacterium]|nr:mechanosensitive ion channel [Clostridia bacterium]
MLETIKSYIAQGGINLVFSAICAIVFVLIGFKLSSWIVKLVKKSRGFQKIDESVATFIGSFIGISLKIIIIVVAATIVGIDVTALSAVLASVGVTIGLAFQGSLSNLAGGIMILFFRPFKVGDLIDNHTDTGVVREIGIFYTTITTVDNKTVTIPNGALSNATIVNYSTQDTRRVDFEFTASYGCDIDDVIKVLLTVALSNDKVLRDPVPFAALHRQDASSLVFILRTWVNSADYWDVYFDIQEQMKKAFDKAGIEIPFNQLDVHIQK